jgi:hypothetical protein
MLDYQKTFDAVLAHLRKQGKRAIDGESCMYRTEDGLKCAIGCLIPDDKYDPKMDEFNYTVRNVLILQSIPGIGDFDSAENSEEIDFLYELQRQLHDDLWDKNYLSHLEKAAEKFAAYWNLIYKRP